MASRRKAASIAGRKNFSQRTNIDPITIISRFRRSTRIVKPLPRASPLSVRMLTHDRKVKGFNVIQFAIGFPCDIVPFDPRGQNEAGDPWSKDFGSINPAYFDLADLRIQWLVEQGMLPNTVGLWGYYLKFMGVDRIKEHWDYIIARYGAYPVTWTLCGEATRTASPLNCSTKWVSSCHLDQKLSKM